MHLGRGYIADGGGSKPKLDTTKAGARGGTKIEQICTTFTQNRQYRIWTYRGVVEQYG